MSHNPAGFLAPLSRFVLEILPWALSGVIGIYLAWGLWSAPAAARAHSSLAQPGAQAGAIVGPRITWAFARQHG